MSLLLYFFLIFSLTLLLVLPSFLPSRSLEYKISLFDFAFKENSSPPPFTAILQLSRDIGSALAEMSALGIIHFNIQMSNILLEQTDRGLTALIADFGKSLKKQENKLIMSF